MMPLSLLQGQGPQKEGQPQPIPRSISCQSRHHLVPSKRSSKGPQTSVTVAAQRKVIQRRNIPKYFANQRYAVTAKADGGSSQDIPGTDETARPSIGPLVDPTNSSDQPHCPGNLCREIGMSYCLCLSIPSVPLAQYAQLYS